LAGVSAVAIVLPGTAWTQTTPLPEVVVNAPSPIRRLPPAGPATPRPGGETQPAAFDPGPGVLPIVADEFATVTVVPDAEIRRRDGRTLGDLLFDKPGITSSSFAPGSASRPIVRGLDNYRVRIQENGLATNDVSEIGEDHGVAIDPLAAQQVEVIRGPATLRYGSQAIGGVVNVDNNRIPTFVPRKGIDVEFRSAVTSVDNGREGAVLIDAGKGNFAVHADAYGRRADDYRIPSYPYLFPEDPAPAVGGRQPNSSQRSNGQSLGASYVFDNGFVGFAVSQFSSLYRVPGLEATETNTRIDMNQTKLTGKGELRPDGGVVEAVRFWLGATDYKHDELADEGGFDGVQQTFTNKAQEGRVEVQLTPFDLRFAALTTAAGIQASHQKLDAPGVEGGLFDPNRTSSAAAYLFNELAFSPTLRAQVAGRIESVSVKGSVPDLFVDPTFAIDRDLDFAPKSGAVGLLKDLPYGLVASITGQYVERAPRAPELFSRGVHEATGTFDVGDPNLRIEKAQTAEIGLRRPKGRLRFEATAYYTRFQDFIYRRLTGATCDEDFTACDPTGTAGEFRQAVYSQRDATFRGIELQGQFDVAPLWVGTFGVDAQYDFVRATFTDGTNVPRIPPQRLGGGVYYRDANWFARVGLLHAFAQDDVDPVAETPTDGYDLLKAELSYTTKLAPVGFGPTEVTFGLVGNNLLDDDVRNAASFKKDEVLMPGRSVRVFANVKF
jgi:iron complex outermembrane receptor protein